VSAIQWEDYLDLCRWQDDGGSGPEPESTLERIRQRREEEVILVESQVRAGRASFSETLVSIDGK